MSSFLDSNGISMGENQIGPAKGNIRGHFEDADFVKLHTKVLAHNKCHMYSPKRHLVVPEALALQAKLLAKKHINSTSAVGWKDPRTSLFLDFWSELVPEAKFILLYRSPNAVIDSMRRRGTDRSIKILPWLPHNAWLRYNEKILNFRRCYGGETLLINIDGFNNSYQKSSKLLADFLNVPLKQSYKNIFHSSEINRDPISVANPVHRIIDSAYKGHLDSLFHALENNADIESAGLV